MASPQLQAVKDPATDQNFRTLERLGLGGGSSFLASHGKGFVYHGEEAETTRPNGFASVEWHGNVQPENWAEHDTWIEYP